MLRLSAVLALFCLASVAHGANLISGVSGGVSGVIRGSVSAFGICAGGLTYVTLADQRSETLVYSQGIVTPQGAQPSLGQRVFGVGGGTTTCSTSGGAITARTAKLVFFRGAVPQGATTTSPTSPSGGSNSGGAQSNPIADQLKGLATDILGSGGPLSNVLSQALGSAAGGAAAGGLIYGGTYTTVIPCNGGIFYIPDFIGVPYSGPVTWLAPAPPYLVNMAAPPTPTQCHIGRLDTPLTCFVGNTLVGVGPRITFYGSSIPGCNFAGAPSAPTAPPATPPTTPEACGTTPGQYQTAAQKLAAERSAREYLSQCNIRVTSSKTGGAACGMGQNGLSAGCTDVSGLQCDALKGLCDIAQKCPMTITGGSEAGHQGHKSGREIDVAVDAACIARNFKAMDTTGCRYLDPATGSTFRNEAVCAAERTTGPHFHLCIGGRC